MEIQAKQQIVPFLWFDSQAEEAMHFYTSIFENSSNGVVTYYGKNSPLPEGTAMTVSFTLNGQQFMGLNGGPHFKPNEAVSFVINCHTQQEVDHFWDKLSEGGTIQQCGWLKDKFGFSWQVIPVQLGQLIQDKDPEKANRVMQAMMQMKKIEIAGLEKAYQGN